MIDKNQVVSIEYEVKENGTDKVLDSNVGGKPLEFIMGSGQIIKGLEEAIAEMSVGDKKEVIVAPVNAYGEYISDYIQEVPRDQFVGIDLQEGMTLFGQGENGETVQVIVKDFNDEVVIKLPRRATKGSAGYDCFAPFDVLLEPGEDAKVPTGIRAYMKQGEALMAFPRSGLGFKYYCRLANTVGIIDSDYYYSDNEGHIFVKLRNEGNKPLIIRQGEAMCQFIFIPCLLADGDSFEKGETRNGGFGSTTK